MSEPREPAADAAHGPVGEARTAPAPAPAGAEERGFWAGRSNLLMPALLAAFSLFLLIGAGLLQAGETEFPGPRFFPILLGAAGLVLAVLIALTELRSPEPAPEGEDRRFRTRSDFVALGWVVGGFLAFALLVPWLGWILAGALVFWCTAHGFGSRRPLFDIVVALFLSSVIYLVFGTGLGLNLPSGILGGGF